jgi:hypothetical protein
MDMSFLNQKFQGKKTYAAAALAVCSGAMAYFSGDASLMTALQLVFTGIMGATLRSGISTEVRCLADCPECKARG